MRFATALIGGLALLTAAPSAMGKTPAKVDWTRTFATTGAGGFRIGNPNAKVTIIEYGSLTCPHCRHFAETAVTPLISRYVRPGKASYEFRPFVLNGVDLAATLVARCNGPRSFFPVMERLYATQPQWVAKVGALSASEQDKLNAMPQPQMMLAIAKISGLYAVGAAHGVAPARAQICLKDQTAALTLTKIEQRGVELGVKGTPSFFINGKQVPVFDWESLEPFLKQAG